MKMLNGIDEVQSQISELSAQVGRTSTVIVAPSDATAKSKAIADYVCDGTNDAEVIRNALHEAIGLGDGGEDFCWTHVQSAAVVPWLDFPFFWPDGEKFYAYGSNAAQTSILRAISDDGVNWVLDTENNPVLTVGAPGSYDDGHVAVFHPWMEDGTWHALYNSNSGICYATSPDGITWTKYAGNPVIPKATDAKAEDPAGLIKVDSTYYLYTNSTGGDRQTDVWTSTNLTSWTKSSDIPAFTGGRYCSCPFKVGSVYYLIVSKQYEGRRGSCLELWSSASPLFRDGERTFLGVVVYGRTWVSVDTPSVLTTTIARDEFYNNEFWCYYAREGGGIGAPHPGYLVKEDSVAAAIAKAVLPRMNGEVLLTEGTIILKDELTTAPAITLDFGITLRGLNTIIKPDTGFNSTKDARGAIAVSPDCLLSGVIIDGNQANTTAEVKMLGISRGGKAENIHLRNCKGNFIIYGEIVNAKIYNNSVNFVLKGHGIIKNSKIYGNSGTSGMYIMEFAELLNSEIFNNKFDGVYAAGNSLIEDCYVHHNGRYGIFLTETSIAKNCMVTYHTGNNGVHLSGTSNMIDCISKYNRKGAVAVAGGTGVLIKGGIISNNTTWGVEGAAPLTLDGTRVYENPGSSNGGQVYLGAVSRVVNCVMDAPATGGKYQIVVTAAATGSVIGNNKLKTGTLGYIELRDDATITEYNNEQIA